MEVDEMEMELDIILNRTDDSQIKYFRKHYNTLILALLKYLCWL